MPAERRTVDRIEAGDMIRTGDGAGWHLVDRVEGPEASTLAILPECVGYAVADDGWRITLTDPGMVLEVAVR